MIDEQGTQDSEQGPIRVRYVAPKLVRLGTLAELTAGGVSGPDDGFGGAGAVGSLP